jgi:hypothetical protein
MQMNEEFDDLMDQILQDKLQEAEAEEELETKNQWGGSKPGKAPNKKRDFAKAYNDLLCRIILPEWTLYTVRKISSIDSACQEAYSTM